MEDNVSEIRDFIFDEPFFDTHDHQEGFDQEWNKKCFSDFLGYAYDDLVTASGQTESENVNKLIEFWPFVRTTGYGQAVEIAVKTLFGLNCSTLQIDLIDEAMQTFIRDKSALEIYDEIYKCANVKWVINDCTEDNITPATYFIGDNFPSFFKSALRFGKLKIFMLTKKEQLQEIESAMNWSIHCLSDLDKFMREYTEKARSTGNLAALKVALAYTRPLDFANAAFSDADRIFTAILKGEEVSAKPLHDYLAHQIFKLAVAYDVPVQIHTGYLAGNWGDIRWGDPAPLVPIFQNYRNVKFDLFHAGWPYSEFIGAVAKEFPNVWINLCWAWAMNPVQMERVLDEWLSCVPSNKIFGFGADTLSPFPVVGYAHQARNGIANVMEKKLNTGEYDLETAKFVTRRIMQENAREVFRM
jgi:hypothetical protein